MRFLADQDVYKITIDALHEYGEDELKNSFCVVEIGRHRIRHL